MTISPLSEATVSKIDSTSTIDSPVSVVKELIDNAIDAGAGSIQVDVDPTSLATITVRDDGVGVRKDDIMEFARPHTTSKILQFNDIAEVQTLGFRGEALSCIANIAATNGTMRVVSRHEGGKVAYGWIVDRNGEASDIRMAAGSKGTAVMLNKLFSHVPVRESYLKKQAKNTIESIRSLVISYGLVYTEVSFSFKVLTRSQLNLTLAPCPALLPKAIMVFGKDFVSDFTEGVEQSGPWKFRYILPKPGAQEFSGDRKKKTNILAVDRRILSKNKPVTKEICSKINSILPRKDLWIIDLYSPRFSYDANVEPGKDDIHFFCLEVVLDKLETFLAKYYDTCSDDELLAELKSREMAKPSSDTYPSPHFETKADKLNRGASVSTTAIRSSSSVRTQNPTTNNGSWPRNYQASESNYRTAPIPTSWEKRFRHQSNQISLKPYEREQLNQMQPPSSQGSSRHRTPSASSSTNQNAYPTPGKTPQNAKNSLKRTFGKQGDDCITPQRTYGGTKKKRQNQNGRSKQKNSIANLSVGRKLNTSAFDPMDDPSFWKDDLVKYVGYLIQLKAATGRYEAERAGEGWWKLVF
ncbi:hypothetical protein TRICI_003544 [Trichomonascus ciferrii]|uniref:DNA mismatch repair protein S5 domain-containing protein n=1 Tax=Trichomonascus ciferrii TaxID=44093 RepID=A0A642V3Q5_9ASCO|nr:hypothetical protein TRICI_003544 [Trichomonascus ciferrii]